MASTSNPIPSPINLPVLDSSQNMETIVTLTLPVAIKLNETNFLTWKSQILPLIHGYNLGRFLDSPSPETTIQNSTSTIEINPTYLHWHRQNQLLLGWLRSSLTEPLLAQVISSTTTRSFWTDLEEYYASTSQSRIHDLKRQIQTASKRTSTCSDYLLRLRRVADELAFIGSPIFEDDLVTATINGLGSDYNSNIAALFTVRCNSSFSFSDLRGLLLSHEALLLSQTETVPSAFYAGRGGGGNRTRYQQRTDHRPQQSQADPSGPNSQPGSGQANVQFPEDKPTCQICNKYGHSAKLCY